jgi:Cu/Ag efflux protein CusF
MAYKGSVIMASLALTLVAACNNSSNPTPLGPAAAVQTTSYQGTGVVKRLDPKAPAIEIDHAEIVGLMPAMQMEFPVKEKTLLTGLAVNDRIDFTVENNVGEMKVIAIKKK